MSESGASPGERIKEIRARLEAATPGPADENGDSARQRVLADANASLIAHAPEDIAYLLKLLRASRVSGDADETCRQWALANVRRNGRDERKCVHRQAMTSMTDAIFSGCVECAFELGRREGQAEAGATMTMDEMKQRLKARVSGDDTPPEGPWYVDESTFGNAWYVGNGKRGYNKIPTESEAIAIRDALNRVAAQRTASAPER